MKANSNPVPTTKEDDKSLWAAVWDIDAAINATKSQVAILATQWQPVMASLNALKKRSAEELTRISNPDAPKAEIADHFGQLTAQLEKFHGAIEALDKAKGKTAQVKALSDVLLLLPGALGLFSSLGLEQSVQKFLPKAGENPKQFLWDTLVPASIKSHFEEIKKAILSNPSSDIERIAQKAAIEKSGALIEKLMLMLDEFEMDHDIKPDHLMTLMPDMDGRSFTNWMRELGRKQKERDSQKPGYPCIAYRISVLDKKYSETEKTIATKKAALHSTGPTEAQWEMMRRESSESIKAFIKALPSFRVNTTEKEILKKLEKELSRQKDPGIVIESLMTELKDKAKKEKKEHQHFNQCISLMQGIKQKYTSTILNAAASNPNKKTIDALWNEARQMSIAKITALDEEIGSARRDITKQKKSMLEELKRELGGNGDPSEVMDRLYKKHLGVEKDSDIRDLMTSINDLYEPFRKGRAEIAQLELQQKRMLVRSTYLSEQSKRKDLLLDQPAENPNNMAPDKKPEPASAGGSVTQFSDSLLNLQKMMQETDKLKIVAEGLYEKWKPLMARGEEIVKAYKAMKDSKKEGDELEQTINLLAKIPEKMDNIAHLAKEGNLVGATALAVGVIQNVTSAATFFQNLKLDASIKNKLMKDGDWMTPDQLLKEYVPDALQKSIQEIVAALDKKTLPEELAQMPREQQLLVLSGFQMMAQTIRTAREMIKQKEEDSAFKDNALLNLMPIPGFPNKRLGELFQEFDQAYAVRWRAAGYKDEPTTEKVTLDVSAVMSDARLSVELVKEMLSDKSEFLLEQEREASDTLIAMEETISLIKSELKKTLDPLLYQEYFVENPVRLSGPSECLMTNTVHLFKRFDEFVKEYRAIRESKPGQALSDSPLAELNALLQGRIKDMAGLVREAALLTIGIKQDPFLKGILNTNSLDQLSESLSSFGTISKVLKPGGAAKSAIGSRVNAAVSVAQTIQQQDDTMNGFLSALEIKMKSVLEAHPKAKKSFATLKTNIPLLKSNIETLKSNVSLTNAVLYIPKITNTLMMAVQSISALKKLGPHAQNTFSQDIKAVTEEVNALLKDLYLMLDQAEIRFGLKEGTLHKELVEGIQSFQEELEKLGYPVSPDQQFESYAKLLLANREALQGNKQFPQSLVLQRIQTARHAQVVDRAETPTSLPGEDLLSTQDDPSKIKRFIAWLARLARLVSQPFVAMYTAIAATEKVNPQEGTYHALTTKLPKIGDSEPGQESVVDKTRKPKTAAPLSTKLFQRVGLSENKIPQDDKKKQQENRKGPA